MSYYLIGIGGTGAKCLEAFIHLNGAGLLKDTQSVKMIFVDADISNGNLKRAQTAANLFVEASKIGFGDSGILKNQLEPVNAWSPIPDIDPNNPNEGKCKAMDEVFQSDALQNIAELNSLNMLYTSLFTKKERRTDLKKGFRGHPAIGAAVINSSIRANDEPMWQELFQQINADADARVFLFGSVFGGTGAAGFPTIAKIIKDSLRRDEENNTAARIGGALILPYFQFPLPTNAEQQELQAKVEDFFLNTKSALEYYSRSNLLNEVFQSLYLIGDNDLVQVQNFSLGSDTQKNEANIIEVYAALAAFDFFNKVTFADTTETPMIARGDGTAETANKIQWEDLPNPCVEGCLKDKLAAYIKFLYVYRHCVLVNLQACAENENKKKEVKWYKDLVEKAGNIDVYRDKQTMNKFNALGDYATAFFKWLEQISNQSNRTIELVNKTIFTNPDIMIDVFKVVLPVVTRQDSLTHKEFWRQLCQYTNTLNRTNSSGAEILMKAVYDICSRE